MASSSTPEVRKTTRIKKPSLKALESLYISKLKNSGIFQTVGSDEDDYLEENSYEEIDVEKPKLLHTNDVITGEEIFKFKTQKRQGLAQKVVETCSSWNATHRKTKSKIEKLLKDAATSGSEYEVSSASGTSDEESTMESSNEDSDSDKPKKTITKHEMNIKTSEINLQPSKARGEGRYMINTEDYFSNCASNKICTSNNTLDKLETPRLPQYELQKLLQDMKLSSEHEKAINDLTNINETFFKNWIYLLSQNFNILVYGLGTKRKILNEFQRKYLNNSPVIVVNGFFPTLSIKNVLDSIIVDLLELEENPFNINEACNLVIQEFKNMINTHLYIIIHNIEGELVRNSKSQNILARLTTAKNIHIIASLDHINAPLIWDHSKLNKFMFIWWDITTFLPYTEETSFERSMMVKQSKSLALSSLRNVFLSLTSNSKSIYILIVKHQLENAKNQYYQGLAFKDLYMFCREAFIVSSDLALRAQLTEFVDHKMVKLKRSVDGTEYLIIPLPKDLLQKFLEDNA